MCIRDRFSTLVCIWGRGCLKKDPWGDQGILSCHPPPGCSGFRAFFPVRTFSEDYRALTGRKNRVLHYQYFLLWYFRYFSPSQELLVAMLAIHRCPQPVILYNQSPRATWLWQHTQKQQKKWKRKVKKKGGCGDPENPTPDVRFESFSIRVVFANNAKSSLYSLSDWYIIIIILILRRMGKSKA